MPFIIVKRRPHQTTPQYYGQRDPAVWTLRWHGSIDKAFRYKTEADAQATIKNLLFTHGLTIERVDA